MQNMSHAAMAQRIEPASSLDDFPTPPWATRALVEHVLDEPVLASMTCLEPACGRGHMSKVLAEYFGSVTSSDVFDYGFGEVADFLTTEHSDQSADWLITNPPFRLAEDFIKRALPIARRGVAMLTRTVFIESVGRYERLFRPYPPTTVAQFAEGSSCSKVGSSRPDQPRLHTRGSCGSATGRKGPKWSGSHRAANSWSAPRITNDRV